AIAAAYAVDGRLPVITFEPMLEQTLLENMRGGESGSFLALDPSYAEAVALQVQSTAERAEQRGEQPVLVCAQPLRPAIRDLVEQRNAEESGSGLSTQTDAFSTMLARLQREQLEPEDDFVMVRPKRVPARDIPAPRTEEVAPQPFVPHLPEVMVDLEPVSAL